MKRINQSNSNMVKVESVIQWPKCGFCGFCHEEGKCPRVKSFDARFGSRKK